MNKKLRSFLFGLVLLLIIICATESGSAAPVSGIDGFGIGTSSYLRTVGDEAYNEQQRMGLRWTREEIRWSMVEQSRGEFLWKYGDYDIAHMLSAVDQRDINVIALLVYGPPYSGIQTSDEWLSRWRAYVQAVVDRFGDQIDYWEIGNEVNSSLFWPKVISPGKYGISSNPNPQFYAEMLKIAYDIIKHADRNDVVILAGLVTVTDGRCETEPFGYLTEIKNAGAWDKFDAIGFHPYWGPSDPEVTIERGPSHDPVTGKCASGNRRDNLLGEVRDLRNFTAQFGPKPIWITEIGWNNSWLYDRANQRGISNDEIEADYLVRTYVPLLSEPGLEKIIWYTQIDDNLGGFRLDEPGKRALGNLAHLLTGSQPLGQIQGQNDQGRAEDDDVYEYRFRNGDTLIVVAWKARGGEQTRPVTLSGIEYGILYAFPSDAADLSLSAGRQMEVINGLVTLDLNEHPVILISSAVTNETAPSSEFWDDIKQKWNDFWKVVGDNTRNWWDEQKRKMTDALKSWWQEQQKKIADAFNAWWQDFQQKALEWFNHQLVEWLNQLCGSSAILPGGVLAAVLWVSRRKNKTTSRK